MRKQREKISNLVLRSVLLTGILIGFLALSTANQFPKNELPVQKTTQDDSRPSEDQMVLKSFEAIQVPTAQINLQLEYLLINILSESEEDQGKDKPASDEKSVLDKIAKILFRKVISPNAP